MYEWDEEKNQENIVKHGVSFERAARIFDGCTLSVVDDRFDYGEVREISIGLVDGVTYLTVAHTDRNRAIRIISARAATRSERKRYDEAISKGLSINAAMFLATDSGDDRSLS